jgi:hypothetical protein
MLLGELWALAPELMNRPRSAIFTASRALSAYTRRVKACPFA